MTWSRTSVKAPTTSRFWWTFSPRSFAPTKMCTWETFTSSCHHWLWAMLSSWSARRKRSTRRTTRALHSVTTASPWALPTFWSCWISTMTSIRCTGSSRSERSSSPARTRWQATKRVSSRTTSWCRPRRWRCSGMPRIWRSSTCCSFHWAAPEYSSGIRMKSLARQLAQKVSSFFRINFGVFWNGFLTLGFR